MRAKCRSVSIALIRCNTSLIVLLTFALMSYSDPKLAHFSLLGRGVDELRSLAERFLGKTDSQSAQMSKVELITELSEEASGNKQLSKTLQKDGISIKPSFYLMRFSDDP